MTETWLDKLRGLVRSMIQPLDYLARYRAKVNAQASDMLTVDATPDDTRIPGMSGIPLRLPPGMRCKVQPGRFVLVGWDSGDPSKPYATPEWDSAGTTIEIHLDATDIIINGGTAKVSRVGDKTKGHTHTVTGTAGPYPINAVVSTVQDEMLEGADHFKG